MNSKSALNIVYDKLDYKSGKLFDLVDEPSYKIRQEDWINKGEWLIAANRAGAVKIFFVDNNPVVVFAKSKNSKEEQIKCYNKLWSLARPRILFLESEGVLSVIDLAQKPIHKKDEERELKSLETLNNIKDASEKLQEFHRDNIESGKVFESGRFGDLKHRADQSLISDLKIVRNELIDAGLSKKYAHALIGRSIFIRYLEDRKILDEAYFKKVANQKAGWTEFINNPASRDQLDFSEIKATYPRILENKEFTYALFKTLAKDFNGDMFPDVDEEENHVKPEHLNLIQDLLYGDTGLQKKLFFFSYNFEIIPLDLISSIYEEFYHSEQDDSEKKKKARQSGTYYTPPVLVEFVLSRVLTQKELRKKPRVLDPACGSGIFLVEAFRRIIRYEWKKKNAPLEYDELKNILGSQITGIEINEDAARITAFSLYLSMLHYLDPPSIQEQIRKENRLPNLLATESKSKNHFNSIHIQNSFYIDKEKLGKIDIIIGNPPWGDPGKEADEEIKNQRKVMIDWCKSKSYSIGDQEPSQAFLWFASDILNDGGCCAFLTSHGVLFKHHPRSQEFRNQWMQSVRIKEVFNFSHVRKFFFTSAISPFLLINFSKEKQLKNPVDYWTAKQASILKGTQSIIFTKYDHAFLVREDLTDNKTWKLNMFGREADNAFVNILMNDCRLSNFIDNENTGQGYVKSPAKYEYPEVTKLNTLYLKELSRYERLKFNDTPKKFYRSGIIGAYFGKRLIVKRGIQERGISKGYILSRFETAGFCFTNAINGLKFQTDDEKFYKLILGILWSSFARYYFFNTTANWGLWHHEIHLKDELLQLPLPPIESKEDEVRIVTIVNKLRNYNPQIKSVINPNGIPEEVVESQRREWEAKLDEAVYDLYKFTKEQRDLIDDCCKVTLPFFYQPYDSIGVKPVIENGDTSWIKNYAEVFAARWKPYLNNDEVMRVDVHLGASGNTMAVEFYPADTGDKWELTPKATTWDYILDEISERLPKPMGTSQIILDGIVHAVSDDSIIIIKRNEKRFWTRSIAREDATTTLSKRMLETMPHMENFN